MQTSLYDYCMERSKAALLTQWHPAKNLSLIHISKTFSAIFTRVICLRAIKSTVPFVKVWYVWKMHTILYKIILDVYKRQLPESFLKYRLTYEENCMFILTSLRSKSPATNCRPRSNRVYIQVDWYKRQKISPFFG